MWDFLQTNTCHSEGSHIHWDETSFIAKQNKYIVDLSSMHPRTLPAWRNSVLMTQICPLTVQVKPVIFLEMSTILHQLCPISPQLTNSYCPQWNLSCENFSHICKFSFCFKKEYQRNFIRIYRITPVRTVFSMCIVQQHISLPYNLHNDCRQFIKNWQPHR